MTTIDPQSVLAFPAPDAGELKNVDEAERQCLNFPDLFLRKAKELNEAQKTLTEVLDDMDQRSGFVVRNLLDAVENCKTLLTAEAAPTVDEAPAAAASDAPPVMVVAETKADDPAPVEGESKETAVVAETAANAEQSAAAEPDTTVSGTATTIVNEIPPEPVKHPHTLGLESVQRSLIYILEEMGVRRIELLGQTYASIVVDGRPIADPFEVVSSTQSGKAMDRKVTQVIRDLWVDRDGRVVQKGSVIC